MVRCGKKMVVKLLLNKSGVAADQAQVFKSSKALSSTKYLQSLGLGLVLGQGGNCTKLWP